MNTDSAKSGIFVVYFFIKSLRVVANGLPRPLNKSRSTGFSKFGGGVSGIRSFVGKYVGAFISNLISEPLSLGLRYLSSSFDKNFLCHIFLTCDLTVSRSDILVCLTFSFSLSTLSYHSTYPEE